MARKGSGGQLGLAEAFMAPGLGQNKTLSKIDGLVKWSRFEKLLAKLRTGERGRPPYPALSMFKALLLQQWYRLSDPELEEALADRLSFRRFCGFALEDTVPDETTICRFRQALAAAGLEDKLLGELTRQLEKRGLILKSGTMVDATLVGAAVSPPNERAGATSAVDPDAAWTKKNNKAHFGYKAHIATDQGSGLIRRAKLTPAKTYESEVADALICGDEQAVYADRAYEQKARRARLKAMGIKDRIIHRRNKHQKALPRWQARRNKLIAPIRAEVERTFGLMKRLYGYTRVRYFSQRANALQLELMCIAINLRRAAKLAT